MRLVWRMRLRRVRMRCGRVLGGRLPWLRCRVFLRLRFVVRWRLFVHLLLSLVAWLHGVALPLLLRIALLQFLALLLLRCVVLLHVLALLLPYRVVLLHRFALLLSLVALLLLQSLLLGGRTIFLRGVRLLHGLLPLLAHRARPRRPCGPRGLFERSHPVPCMRCGAHAEPGRSSVHQRAKSDVLWMNVFSFEMFTLPKPVVASQPAFAL
ncbi:hypothetical protein [Burkholderia lata]|uniref:hypothetical protein n=1 Tax=Burkholderia lata (strain ATCC 17760 / DSM 23089 / LMG 22485 / NCIMB 9086 / R18194 / 383) TaxID=482957 RepID=UPI0012EA447E|nr:hypothetical protein [Burkholderia lata]